MSTQVRLTRRDATLEGRLGSGFGTAVLLHVAVLTAIAAAGLLLHHTSDRWGESAATAGAIQATMVSALPLPPRQRTLDTGVLTSEKPSPAPVQTKEKTEPLPEPKTIPIPVKQAKPVKTAKVATPEPPKHPQPVPQTTKAETGETAGIRIAQATTQTKNGTASIFVEDRAFGARYAYYVNIVNRTVAQNWYSQEADPRASAGKRVVLIFNINREGTPNDVKIETPSGSPTLDASAMRALQRVEGFGPLPAGNSITVEFAFDYKQ
jgi:protein TonB